MRVHIDETVWHLDVGSSHPGVVKDSKGSAVRRLKWYVSWVQNVVRQFGPYLLLMLKIKKTIFEYERTGKCLPLVYRLFFQEHRRLAK